MINTYATANSSLSSAMLGQHVAFTVSEIAFVSRI